MSALKVQRALEIALAAMTPALTTAWKNQDFTPPAWGTPWQEASVLFLKPGNTALGSGYYQERGVLQVALHYPAGKGTKDPMERAELLRSTFERGSSFLNSGVTVRVDETPRIGLGMTNTAQKEWVLPITISFHADVFL